jgi:hypothetical protein
MRVNMPIPISSPCSAIIISLAAPSRPSYSFGCLLALPAKLFLCLLDDGNSKNRYYV